MRNRLWLKRHEQCEHPVLVSFSVVAIIGGLLGVVGVIVLVGIAGFFLKKRRETQNGEELQIVLFFHICKTETPVTVLIGSLVTDEYLTVLLKPFFSWQHQRLPHRRHHEWVKWALHRGYSAHHTKHTVYCPWTV